MNNKEHDKGRVPTTKADTESFVGRIRESTKRELQRTRWGLTPEQRKEIQQEYDLEAIEAKRAKETDPTLPESKRQLAEENVRLAAGRTRDRRAAERCRAPGEHDISPKKQGGAPPDIEETLDTSRQLEQMADAMKEVLNASQREIVLGRLRGAPYSEIAALLGIRADHCRRMHKVAVERLSAALRSAE